MKNKEIRVNEKGETLRRVPLRINPETIEENGFSKKDIIYVRIGYRKYPCILQWVTENEYRTYMRIEWADVKAEEREGRCPIPNGKGGFIRCPECNKCSCCEKIGHFDFDTNHTISLDALNEDVDYEPESTYFQDEDKEMYLEILEMLIQELSKKKPKYGSILRELYNGNMEPINIAKKLKLPVSSTYEDVPKVQKLASELYKKYI